MAEERVQRRLAAILAADVAGFSRSMGIDEEGTLAQLKAHRRDLVDPKVNEYQGRIVKTVGDGILVEFASVVDALRCAIDIQHAMVARNADVRPEKRIEFRIGINVGDIIVDGGDIYGDGVNVAARLEGLAEPNGICVSRRVLEDARGKLDASFEDAGEQQLKNIAWPVQVYRLRPGGKTAMSRPPLPLPDKPSVAILPFQNMSGDPAQEYFADGMVEDITTALSRFRNLFVIARNSSFTYKGRAVDVTQVGRELGVRYVLEGSVRKAGDRLRVTGQLVDASTGATLWADRFDGAFTEIFDLQDQVAANVVGAIAPRVEDAEIERAKRKPTESVSAYDHYLRALAVVNRMTRESNDEALRLFSKAIERDPEFALAYARAAHCYVRRKANGWMVDRSHEPAEAERLARRAVELGRDDAVALSYGGHTLGYVVGDLEDGAAFVERALVLNSNLAAAWGASGWMKVCFGEPDTAIKHAALAMRLSPLDPRLFVWQFNTALAHLCAGRYDDAAIWGERALRDQPIYPAAMRITAASHALARRLAEAQKLVERLRQIDPPLRISNLGDVMPPFRRPEDRAKYVEGLRIAGLPE
jgi:TolB-like protein/class 3 adenylate cyclase/Tfp pilus assembly protein PilF